MNFEDRFFEILSSIEDKKITGAHSSDIKKYLKKLYDDTKYQEKKRYGTKSSALPKMIIKNMDNEQIWQQLELQNREFLDRNSKKLDQLLSIQLDDKTDPTEENEEQSDGSSESSEGSDDEESENMDIPEDDDSEQNLSEEDSQEVAENSKPTDLSDDEFDMQEMEKFLESQEKKDQIDDSDEEEGDIDYFAEESDGSDNEKAVTAKFKDFFRENEKTTKVKFAEDEMLEDEEENLYSNFELRQDRLQKRIEAIESNAVAEKPWTLKGEIRADSRPINSLLEEDVEFDRSARPAPIVTGQTSLMLEDIIKQRIKDKAFDSVEKKEIAVEKPSEYKKKLLVSQEKSKESLAQIYEKEYLQQLDPEDKEQEETEQHKEIKKEMEMLFRQLDALSNYHYTPKPAIPELKIIKNIPALCTEEVGPVVISDAPLLAPQQVKAKPKGDILGKSERSATAKKRERRKKKAKQRNIAKKEEKKNTKNKIEKVIKNDASIKKMAQGRDGALKSSRQFFQQLDEREKK